LVTALLAFLAIQSIFLAWVLWLLCRHIADLTRAGAYRRAHDLHLQHTAERLDGAEAYRASDQLVKTADVGLDDLLVSRNGATRTGVDTEIWMEAGEVAKERGITQQLAYDQMLVDNRDAGFGPVL